MAATFNARPATAQLIHMEDPSGRHASLRVWLAGAVTSIAATAPAAILTAVEGATDLAVTSCELVLTADRSNPPDPDDLPSTPYTSGLDKLKFRLKASDGSLVSFDIGAPLAAVLDSIDKTLVDMANTDVAAMLAAIRADFKTAEGTALTDASIKQAYRTRPSRRKQQLGVG